MVYLSWDCSTLLSWCCLTPLLGEGLDLRVFVQGQAGGDSLKPYLRN